MPSNIEVKAHVRNLELLLKAAKELSGSEGTKLIQEDTFFNVSSGRLKLRVEQNSGGQLIYYNRSDISGPKLSNYRCTFIQNPDDLKNTLSLALGIRGYVRKVRLLYLVGQTRVHVDNVEGLGNFMELEVCMRTGQATQEGESIAQDIMEKLGIDSSDLITCAYMDLIESNQKEQ